jgi:class 3 adenylate cyclase
MERRLTAILAADVVGYSSLMGKEEVGTLERLKICRRELFDPAVAEFRGRVIKLMGDGALVEVASVVDAVARGHMKTFEFKREIKVSDLKEVVKELMQDSPWDTLAATRPTSY